MNSQTTLLNCITCAIILLIACFGTYILKFLECSNYEEVTNTDPIIFPLIPKIESYENIIEQINSADTINELNTALIDIYIFSGSYTDSEGLKNILFDTHFKKENELKNHELN